MKKSRITALIFVMTLALRCAAFPTYSEAATATEIQQQIDEAEKEKEN